MVHSMECVGQTLPWSPWEGLNLDMGGGMGGMEGGRAGRDGRVEGLEQDDPILEHFFTLPCMVL